MVALIGIVKMSNKIVKTVLVDSNSIAHMVHLNDCYSKDEFILRFMSLLNNLIYSLGFICNVILFFDNKENNWRKNLYKNYQSNRSIYKNTEDTEKLNTYVLETIKYIKNKKRYVIVDVPGSESDDLIALYCYNIKEEHEHVTIMTTDKDLYQLIDKNNAIDVFYLRDKTLIKDYLIGKEILFKKVLLGDPSDSIPTSCKGIGISKLKDYIKFIQILNKSSIYSVESESELKEICKKNNIKFFKAYLNFNRNQLNLNKKLIDLRYVNEMDKNNNNSLTESIRRICNENSKK